MSVSSFAAHREDGIEPRRTARRISPGDDADPRADADGEHDRPWSDGGGQRRHLGDDLGQREVESDAGESADGYQRRRIDEELHENVPTACSYRRENPLLGRT